MASKKIMYDGENQKIERRYIENLHTFQEKEGILLANKMGKAHIN